MEQLWYAIDRVAPLLHTWVALLGKVPSGAVTIAGLVALWYLGRRLAHFVVVAPGLVVGVTVGWWLYAAHGWHPLFALAACLAASAAIFQILVNFLYVRLALAVIAGPLAIVAVWHLAAGALDVWWALAITSIGAMSIGSLLRRLVNTENHRLYVVIRDLIDDLRGD